MILYCKKCGHSEILPPGKMLVNCCINCGNGYEILDTLQQFNTYKVRRYDFENHKYNYFDLTKEAILSSSPYYSNLMLCTGQVDVNGIELYSGDIVRYIVPGITHGPDSEDGIGEIFWSFEDSCFYIDRDCSYMFNEIEFLEKNRDPFI